MKFDPKDIVKLQDACEGTGFVPIPVEQLADIYERFLRLTRMGQRKIEEWSEMDKTEADIRHQIFRESDFGAVFAGQWLPPEVRTEVAARHRYVSTQPLT